jgi:hypothetical protein
LRRSFYFPIFKFFPSFARRHVERTAVAGLDIRIATQDDLERAIADQTPVEESQAQKKIL